MTFPGLFFSLHQQKGQFIIILYGEYTPESNVGLKVQFVLSVQGNISSWVVMCIATKVKTQCSVRVMDQSLFHGFTKDLGPSLWKVYMAASFW